MEDPNYSRNYSGHGRGNYKKKQHGDNRQRGSNGHQDRYHTFQMESRNQEHRKDSQRRYSLSKNKEPTQNLPSEKEKQHAKLVDNSHQIEKETTEVESSSQSLAPIDCVICTEPIKYFVVGRCNHKQVCLLCSLRRRKLYQEYDCAVCRKILDCVIVTSDQAALFENFDVRQMDSHYDGKFYHLEPYFLEVTKMWELACQICNKRNFSSITELEKHVEVEHKLQYCKLCLEYRKVFLSEQKLYTPNTLLLHLTEVDPETRVKHEVCEICMQPFYDTESFYHHIQTNCRGGSAPNTYASTPQRSSAIQEQFSLVAASQNRNILPSSSTWGRNRIIDVNEDNFPALGNSPSRNSNQSTPSGSWGERKLEQSTASTANANANSNSNSTPPFRGVQNISSNQRQRQQSDPVVLHFGGLPTARRKK